MSTYTSYIPTWFLLLLLFYLLLLFIIIISMKCFIGLIIYFLPILDLISSLFDQYNYIPEMLDYITMIYANECPIVQDLLNQCLSKALRCFIVTVNS